MSEISQGQEEQLVEVQAGSSDGRSEETTPTEVSAEANPDTPPPATTPQPPEVDIDQAVASMNWQLKPYTKVQFK